MWWARPARRRLIRAPDLLCLAFRSSAISPLAASGQLRAMPTKTMSAERFHSRLCPGADALTRGSMRLCDRGLSFDFQAGRGRAPATNGVAGACRRPRIRGRGHPEAQCRRLRRERLGRSTRPSSRREVFAQPGIGVPESSVDGSERKAVPPAETLTNAA